MEENKSFKERLEERLSTWKQSMDELMVQLNLGQKEARDEFQRQKRNLKDWLEQKQPLFDNIKEEVSSDAATLKTKVQNLLDRLRKDQSGGEEINEEELAASMEEIQDQAEELEENATGETEKMAEDFSDQLNIFRSRLFGLATAIRDEAKEEWEELKEDSTKAMEVIRKKSGDISEEAKEEWEELKSDARALFKFVRRKMQKGKDEDGE